MRRRAVVAMLGRACRHNSVKRSTSAGSVISVSGSVPAAPAEINSSLLPQRSRWACWRLANGARPSTSNASAGSRAAPGGDARRSTQTSAKKIQAPAPGCRRPSRPTAGRPASCPDPCGSWNCAASVPATARPLRRTIPMVPPRAQPGPTVRPDTPTEESARLSQIADRMDLIFRHF